MASPDLKGEGYLGRQTKTNSSNYNRKEQNELKPEQKRRKEENLHVVFSVGLLQQRQRTYKPYLP